MLSITDLRFEYDSGHPVFDGLTVSVESGHTVAVLGANGTGKTTLLRLIAGLLDPNSGTIAVEGTEDPVVGLTPEIPADGLFARTVEEEVAFFPKNRGLDVETRVTAALESLGIGDLADREPQTLSEGQKQLVTVASVLSGAPDLIGLDEPTSGLDGKSCHRLGTQLSQLSETVLLATHDVDFAWEFTDRVLVLSETGLARYGPTRSVLADPALDLERLGLQPPEPVTWARKHDIETPPRTVAEAVERLEADR